jgi:hypothetical protein
MAVGGLFTIANNAYRYHLTAKAGEERPKGQALRLFNVVGNGPFLIWYGSKEKTGLCHPSRAGLVATGAATIVYNTVNYVKQSRRAPQLST